MAEIRIKTIPGHFAYTAEYDVEDYNDFFDPNTGENVLLDLEHMMHGENPDVIVPDEPEDYNYFEHPAGQIPRPPMRVRYFDMTESLGTDSRAGAYRFVKKPAIQAACMEHQGAYETIGSGYEAVFKWIKANGYQVAGPGRSSAIHGPWDRGADRDQYVIEIQIPIK